MNFFKTPAIFCLFLLFASAHADFGNFFVANKRLSTPLNASTQKISYRFTCEDDMTLSGASVFCLDAIAPPAYLVTVQEDVNGLPSGTALATASYVPLAQSWSSVFYDSVPLIKGKVYHLVVEQDALRNGYHPVGLIGPNNFASFLSTDVLNHMHPNDQSPDPAANTLFFDKGKWQELNQEPVYAIFGTGTQFQGNASDDPGVLPIYHQMTQGQALHFHCGYPVKALAFRIKKQGSPKAPLKYVILSNNYRAHTCHILHTDVVVNPDEASSNFQWVTVGIPEEVSRFPAECYFFVLQTESGHAAKNAEGCEDGYVLSDVGNSGGLAHAADLSFDGGPHLSREVRCVNGDLVTGWADEFERDANVAAIGPICPLGQTGDTAPLPTPVPFGVEP